VKRYGMVIGLNREKVRDYTALHGAVYDSFDVVMTIPIMWPLPKGLIGMWYKELRPINPSKSRERITVA